MLNVTVVIEVGIGLYHYAFSICSCPICRIKFYFNFTLLPGCTAGSLSYVERYIRSCRRLAQ